MTQTGGCLPVGGGGRWCGQDPGVNEMCFDFGAANFRGQLQNPAILKANAAVGPDPGVPRAVAPEAAARIPIASGWEGRCAHRTARGPRWRRGRWPPGTRRVAGGIWPLPVPPRPPSASGTWESWGHFERQHPVRWEAAKPAVRGENPGRRSRSSDPGQQCIRFGPNATLRTWSAKRRLPDPHSPLICTYPHPGTRPRSRGGWGQRWPRASGRASGAPPTKPRLRRRPY